MADKKPETKVESTDPASFENTAPAPEFKSEVAGSKPASPLKANDQELADLDKIFEEEVRKFNEPESQEGEVAKVPSKEENKPEEPKADEPKDKKAEPIAEKKEEKQPEIESKPTHPDDRKSTALDLSAVEEEMARVRNDLSKTEEGRKLLSKLDGDGVIATEEDIDKAYIRLARKRDQVKALRKRDADGVMSEDDDDAVVAEQAALQKKIGAYVPVELAYRSVKSTKVGDALKKREEALKKQSHVESVRKAETARGVSPEVGGSATPPPRPQAKKKDLWKEVEEELRANMDT